MDRQAPFPDREHLFQNIGDGTFLHSGSLAHAGRVAAGANITYKLLYNAAVAMTGGQGAAGACRSPQIARELEAEGVRGSSSPPRSLGRYRGVKLPRGMRRLGPHWIAAAQRELAAQGVTVLIHDQQCATQKRRQRKRGKLAQPRRGCSSTSGSARAAATAGESPTACRCSRCRPSSAEDPDRAVVLQQGLLLRGRRLPVVRDRGAEPSGPATSGGPRHPTSSRPRARRASRRCSASGSSASAAPASSRSARCCDRRVLDGCRSAGLDQTGLTQKAGPVVSDSGSAAAGAGAHQQVGAGVCDLYLGFDLLVAADPKNSVGPPRPHRRRGLPRRGPDRADGVRPGAGLP